MREATDGKGAGFDAIIENEYRGIDDGKTDSIARRVYLLVCCFHQHGVLIRDRLLEDVLGVPLKDLYEDIGSLLLGLVEYPETDRVRGEYAARARHRIIAEIVWKKCGSRERKEGLLQKAMESLNLTYRLDKAVFDVFIRSDEIVDTFSTLDGKMKFFETAARRDPSNPFCTSALRKDATSREEADAGIDADRRRDNEGHYQLNSLLTPHSRPGPC